VHEYKWHKPYMVIVHYSTLLPATQVTFQNLELIFYVLIKGTRTKTHSTLEGLLD